MVPQMVEQTGDASADAPSAGPASETKTPPTQKRVYSEVPFPYIDMEPAVALAQAINEHAGNSCGDTELAAWLNQSAEGGTYKARRSAARMFGFIAINGGVLTLTALGREAIDKAKSRSARAEAFLKPELYRLLYEKFGGHALPPAAAVDRQIEQLGVSPKQKERARQAFQKSAVFAGFIDAATERFVRPGNAASGASAEKDPPAEDGNRGGGGGGGGGGGHGGDGMPRHPLVLGLFQSLPADGTVWSLEDAAAWMEAAAVNLRLAYKFKGSIKVEATAPKPPTTA